MMGPRVLQHPLPLDSALPQNEPSAAQVVASVPAGVLRESRTPSRTSVVTATRLSNCRRLAFPPRRFVPHARSFAALLRGARRELLRARRARSLSKVGGLLRAADCRQPRAAPD